MRQVREMDRSHRLRDWAGAFAALVWMLGFASVLPCEAAAQELSVEESVALVRALHFEGIPEDRARRVGPDGAARLMTMLMDPTEVETHAHILIVLGMCGQPGTLDAISAWAATEYEGEIDRDRFRAWQALPFALGYAAEFDRRAVRKLERRLSTETPTWTFRHHRGARLHRQSRRAAATALGMTGLDEADEVLDRVRLQTTDVEFEKHVRGAREMNADRKAKRAARRGQRR